MRMRDIHPQSHILVSAHRDMEGMVFKRCLLSNGGIVVSILVS